MSTRRLVASYTAAMIAALVLYYAWPDATSVAVGIAGLASAGAVVVGVRRYRPARPRPWLLIAAALLFTAAARIVFEALPGEPGLLKPWAWTVWVLHLVMAGLLIAGVIGLTRPTAGGLPGAIDAAIIALGAGLAATIVIAIPYSRLPGPTALYVGVRIAYVLRDVLILAAALLLITAARRNRSVLLLFLGLMGLLVYDVFFRVQMIRGVFLSGTPIDAARLGFYVAVGAAALLPSMATADAPRATGEPEGDAGAAIRRRRRPARRPRHRAAGRRRATVYPVVAWCHLVLCGWGVSVRLCVCVSVSGCCVRRRGTRRRPGCPAIGLHRSERGVAPARVGYAGVVPADGPRSPDDGVAMEIPSSEYQPSRPASGESTMDGADWPVLLIWSQPRELNAIQSRLDVLATEAALAVERLRLSGQVISHAKEAYFRALVQNSTTL